MTQISQPAQPSQPTRTIDVDARPLPPLPPLVQCPLGGPCKTHYGKAFRITRGTANQSQISKNFSSGACATNAAYYLSLHVLKVVTIGGNPPILCRSPKNPPIMLIFTKSGTTSPSRYAMSPHVINGTPGVAPQINGTPAINGAPKFFLPSKRYAILPPNKRHANGADKTHLLNGTQIYP